MSPVNVNPGEYRSTIGLDDLYVAEVTADSASGYTADTPEYFAPAAQASQAPVTSVETQYADDQPFDIINDEAETNLNLTVTGMPMAMLAKVLGKVFDPTTGRMYDNHGTPPYIALSFRSMKSNGSYRYYQYLKGKFSVPNEEAAARAAQADPKTIQLTYKAIRTTRKFDLGAIHDHVKRVMGDDDTDAFDGSTWYSQVQTPSVATPDVLSLSSSIPADGAIGVGVSSNLVLTFNNALPATAIYNVMCVKSDGTAVVSVNSLDETKKILTLNPDSNLSAASTYIVTYAVIDIYGDSLSGAINFTTA